MTMRKLKLQVQMTIDGYAATTNRESIDFNWDDVENELKDFEIANLEQVDSLILGRKTAPEFIPYWAVVAENPDDPWFLLGKKLTDTPKIVFSKTLANSEWANTTVAKGEIVDEINNLKKQPGNDIMVYGGVSFVSSLIMNGLIDEYYLAVNPIAIGSGWSIFKELDSKQRMTLVKTTSLKCGIVWLQYEPKNT